MGLDDKIDHAAEKLGDKAKEAPARPGTMKAWKPRARPIRPRLTSSRPAKRSRMPSSTTDLA